MTMTPERYARVKEIFQTITALPQAEQIAALKSACGDDQQLFAGVSALLEHHDEDAAIREGRTVIQTANTQIGSDDADSRTIVNDKNVRAKLQPSSTVAGWIQAHSQVLGRLMLVALAATVAIIVAFIANTKVTEYVQRDKRQLLSASVEHTVDAIRQWVDRRTLQAQIWSKDPELVRICGELTQLARDKEDAKIKETLPQSGATIELREYVRERIGDAKYVLWDSSGLTIASWQEKAEDVGNRLPPSAMSAHAQVMQGEAKLQFPTQIDTPTDGFQPDTGVPLMWLTFPVVDTSGKPFAVMLIRDIGLMGEFQRFFSNIRVGNSADVFAISARGTMLSESRHLNDLHLTQIVPEGMPSATHARVADPGGDLLAGHTPVRSLDTLPLTEAAARVTAGENAAMMHGYRDIRGKTVVGAWRWMEEFQLGVICEVSMDAAYAMQNWLARALTGLVLVPFLALAVGVTTSWFFHREAEKDTEKVMAGAYELLEKIGEGGMGYVYRARHSLLKRASAVKVLRPDRLTMVDVGRFDREVKLAAQLNSPHTIQIFDYGRTDDGMIYFAMEYLNGLALDTVINRSGALGAARTMHFLIQLCKSVEEAHTAGLIHRDIKPQNIMVTRRGNEADWLILFDFGLAKSVAPDTKEFRTRERIWAGTPMFMSPERVRTPAAVDPRMDVYAIGAVAYLMLTGKEPFTSSNTEMLFDQVLNTMPDSPTQAGAPNSIAQLDAVVLKCLAKDPNDRPDSASQLRMRLEQLAAQHVWSAEDANAWWLKHSRE